MTDTVARSVRAHWIACGAAIVIPTAVALVLPHPMNRPLIPATLAMIAVMTFAILGFRPAAILASLAAGASIWYFTLPPADSFAINNTEDAFSVAAIFVLGLFSSMLIGTLAARDARRRVRHAEDRAAAETDRATLNAVQAAILPRALRSVDGVEVKAAYRMGGAASAKLGGDFYLLIPFANGTLGIGIGDVAGHGPSAVGSMAELRMTLRAVASIIPDPVLALERLELLLQNTGSLDFATVLYGVLDPMRQELAWVNAGHVPPILRHDDGTTEVLAGVNAGALCRRAEPTTFEVNRTSLRTGDTLVLYTDGLVESRHHVIDDGIRRACELVRADFNDPFELTERLLAAVPGPSDDDIAIVVATLGVPHQTAPRPHTRSKYFARRPSRVRARQAEPGEVLETPLGIWTAKRGDWVVSNRGAHQLVPANTFEELFDLDPDPPVETAHLELEPSESAVRATRDFVAAQLAPLDVDRQSAVLLASELATNAVRHAATKFDVVVSSDREGIEVSVRDWSPKAIEVSIPRRDAEHGRGLMLVDSLADEWGVTMDHDHKEVWFRLRRNRR